MQPIYPYVAVEKIEDTESAIVQTIEQKPVVRVVAIPVVVDGNDCVEYTIGQRILVNHVDEYMVDGEKLYFVRVRDVVSIV